MKREHTAGRGIFPYFDLFQNNGLQGKQAFKYFHFQSPYAKGRRKEWCPIHSRMEEHVVVYRYVSAAKGKLKVKRPSQREVGDKLEDLRSELDSLTSLLPLEPDENLSAELDRLPSLELQEPEEVRDLEEAKEHAELKESEDAEEHEEPKESEEAEVQEEADKYEEPKKFEEAKEHRMKEAEKHGEPKEAEEAKEQEERKESVRALDGLINIEVSRSKTVQAWYNDLLQHLTIVSALPRVTNSTFCDARKLFAVNHDNKVTLRNPGYVGGYEDIVLLQFDPNFMSTDVVCRHPSCNNVNPAAAKSGKRDLYLCPHHQQVLRNSISGAFAKKSIEIPTSAEKPEPGHFAGYTSLISLLEGAYHDAKKFQTLKGKSLTVQEAILNVRNFLVITSTVLNPDEDNLGIALPPVVQIFRLILENPATVELLGAGLIYVLQEVIEMILFAFGVIYTWVSLALSSPGAQIGAGVGGCIGAIAFVLGPWSGAAGVAVGGTLGGLIGNGIYNLRGEQRRQEIERFREHWRNAGRAGPNGQPNNQYPVYYFNGDALGGLDLNPFPAV